MKNKSQEVAWEAQYDLEDMISGKDAYIKIVSWLYQKDKALASAVEWREEFVKTLQEALLK